MRILCAAVCLLLASTAGATVLHDWSLDERVARADIIVVGTVTDERVRREDGRLWTDTRIHVEQTLLGQPPHDLWVSQLGGRDGGEESRWIGTAPLARGARVALLCYRQGGRLYLVGMTLGAFQVAGARLSQEVDAELAGADGRLRPPPGHQEAAVDELVAAIARRRGSK